MPRAGAGSGGGNRSSGGHSSSPRSSGGHRLSGGGGGSSRPSGGGHPSGGGRPGGGPRPVPPRQTPPRPNPVPPPPHHNRGPIMSRPPRRRRYGGDFGGGCLSSVVGLIVVVIVLIVMIFSCTASTIGGIFGSSGSSQIAASTVSREKLSSSSGFDSDCIVDELGWFDNAKSAGKSLKTFYDKTGVQPYVVLLGYDSSLGSDSDKEEFAQDYYEENIGNEDAFLFMYFAEEKQDDDVGYMCYVCGNNARSVMDSEAVDIFWDYVDANWYSDLSTDELFETVFDSTADRIMSGGVSSGSTSGAFKIIRNVVIVGVVILVAVLVVRKKKGGATGSSDSEVSKDNPNILN